MAHDTKTFSPIYIYILVRLLAHILYIFHLYLYYLYKNLSMILEKGGEMICGHIRQAPYTDTVMWALRCMQCAVIRIWSGHFMHTHTRPTHMQIVAHMHAGRHRKECGKRLNNKYTRTHRFRPFIYTSNAIYNTIQQSKRIVILNGHISASLSFFFLLFFLLLLLSLCGVVHACVFLFPLERCQFYLWFFGVGIMRGIRFSVDGLAPL